MLAKANKIIINKLCLPMISWVGLGFIKLIMRTFIFLFCATLFGFIPEHALSQSEKIEIERDMVVSVDAVFEIIKGQTEYSFVYDGELFKHLPKVPLKKGKIRLGELLEHSLGSGGIDIVFTSNRTILLKVNTAKLQERKVTGTVKDQAGVPLAGATVRIKGTSKGVITDLEGKYWINVPDSNSVLEFSFLGFETLEAAVGNRNVVNVNLKENVGKLEEVVLKGYYNTTVKYDTGNVSGIKSKTIAKQPVNNPLAAMQGHIAGVNIVQTTGAPGGGFNIQIRGLNSISGGAEPLYIIDGVPYSSESLESQRLVGTVLPNNPQTIVSPLNAINPADIESIEVLKDADATAIYGSRGANGVVLITTKKGRAGKTKIKVNLSGSLSEVTRFVDLLNTEEFLELRREGLANDGLFPVPPSQESFYPELFAWDNTRYTDWQEELLGGTAYRYNAQLSFLGGSEQTQFLLSGGYSTETTVYPGDTEYTKASVHANINHRSEDNRFKIDFSANYVSENNRLPGVDFTRLANTLAPNAPAIYDAEGNLNWENSTWVNPFANLESEYLTHINSLRASTVLSYRPISKLELKTRIGYTDYNLESFRTKPNTLFNPALELGTEFSGISNNNGSRQSWIVEPQITWTQSWDASSLNILLGGTFQHQRTEQFAQNFFNYPNNELLFNFSAAAESDILDDRSSEYNYQAFFGRINFNWEDRYILNLTGRRDGSSRFGPGKQFGNFGAVGMAWIFTEEDFFKKSKVFSFGKLRGSYGITGSDNIGDYGFLNTYSVVPTDYDGSIGLRPTRLFNPDFGWERNNKLEIAMELGFWKDRVFLNTSWYQNRSSNQLVGIPLPGTTGFSTLNGNLDATVENKGWEVELRSSTIQRDNFNWTTSLNVTVPKNKLVKYDNLESSTNANLLVIGQPLSVLRLYDYIGLDPDTGIHQFEDYNNDGVIDIFDRQRLETLDPSFFGGLDNTVSYGNFELNVFFQFTKQKGYSPLRLAAAGGNLNMSRIVLDRWQQPGDVGIVQRSSVGGGNPEVTTALIQFVGSTGVLTDASFIRCRNVSLTYSLPKKITGDTDISLYLQGQNLFTLTNLEGGGDPERGSNSALPPLRQFSLGLDISF